MCAAGGDGEKGEIAAPAVVVVIFGGLRYLKEKSSSITMGTQGVVENLIVYML